MIPPPVVRATGGGNFLARGSGSIAGMAPLLLLLASVVAAPAQGGTVRADVLRNHLAYLASDELAGRATPSAGLDAAADYIASQFRAAGLKPVDGKYFQEAPDSRLNREGLPTVKNVIGVLAGTDPELRDTYVLITAHYDHVGIRDNAEGDKIFNGANDNGSGTVGVIAIAQALGASGFKPKRTVVFMTFFGEERGLVGSRFYGENPVFPLERTVAMLNLEMIGRTKKYSAASRGERTIEDWTGRLGVTGYDYSDMGARLAISCKKGGIEIVNDEAGSDPFFLRSDNRALALKGIPAHTVSVGYIDPEYHKANDHWETINYENMAKVVNALVYATMDLANDPVAPKWNEENPKAARYVEASRKLHGGVVRRFGGSEVRRFGGSGVRGFGAMNDE